MRQLLKIYFLLAACISISCNKNTDDYQPPIKGNVSASYFTESTWNVMESTISIPDSINDFCMRNLKKIYFGSSTCILTGENKATKKEYKGNYRIENVNENSTILYLDNLTHGSEVCSYVLTFDEINTSRNSTSLVMDLHSGNLFHKKSNGKNYGTFRLTK